MGDITSQVVQLVAQIFQAIMMGTVFYHLPDATSGYFSHGGILFFALFFGALSAMAEIPALYAQCPIVLHHYKAAMYYPFIKSLAHTVVNIPIMFIIQGVFSVLLYFLVDLQRTVSQFFIFFLVVFTMTTMMKGFFRLVTAAFKEESSATSVAGIDVLVFSLYFSYTFPRLSIPDALCWITYLNPLGFGFESLMMNEFHTLNRTCFTMVPQHPGYENVSLANQVCTTVGAQPGMSTVDDNAFTYLSYDYKYRLQHYLCAFGISFLLMLLFATKFNISSTFDSAVTLFKQFKGAGSVGPVNVQRDEEKGAPLAPDEREKKHGLPDTFTWHHVQYVVPISGGSERRLLDDVSGYVAPGKLTALINLAID
ncbi:ABC-2 type transporter-domain-containing protein [Suillus cothurnatus]|nr:ABC-2 type transporter-domain-containing protein [Suillus cothurnatus]